jgi:ferredoxin-NADP reductase
MREYLLALKDRREVAEGTMAFWFDTVGTDFTFEAGQNAEYTLIDPPATDAEGNTRTFSFASSPSHKDSFMVATRMRPTAFKNSLKQIPLGTKLKVDGPYGDMVLQDDASKAAVFLTGGIGITPMRSMIKWATEEKKPHQLYLLYSNRAPAATAFLSDFGEWAKANPNLHLALTITDSDDPNWKYEKGIIDEAFIRKHVPDVMNAVYYIAGPPGMVLAMRKILIGMGLGRDNIRVESFTGY